MNRDDIIERLSQEATSNADMTDLMSTYYNIAEAGFKDMDDEELQQYARDYLDEEFEDDR